ncbi:MAG: response regulator [Taibaiella sp.]|jgi:Response regulator containing CheY-like receiver, AAA-type ATPase, and DNA-binding domains|nr:response regulator [Taibaiella sp.]
MALSDKRYVFLVDDEPIQNEMLKDFLSERYTYEIKIFESGEEAMANMHLHPEIIVLDYHLNAHLNDAKNGVEILKDIKDQYPETQVIMLSGQDKIDVAIDTMKYGAFDYIVKGESAFSRIENVINNASELHKLKVVNEGYKRTITLLTIVIGLIIIGALFFTFVKPVLGQ